MQRIFHKILYRLSNEQRKQFFGEEASLSRAVDLQGRVTDHLNGIFYVCEACNRKLQFHSPRSEEKIQTNCGCCRRVPKFLQLEHIRPQFRHAVDPAPHKSSDQLFIERIDEIVAEIMQLRDDEIVTKDGYLTFRYCHLLDELKYILDQLVEDRTRRFERLNRSVRVTTIKDLRKRFRSISAFLFKNLPDFSGSEEEAVFDNLTVRPISSFLNSKLCPTIQSRYYPRSTWLSNLRMTG